MKSTEDMLKGKIEREVEAKLKAGQIIFRRKSVEDLLLVACNDRHVIETLASGEGRKHQLAFEKYIIDSGARGMAGMDYVSWLEINYSSDQFLVNLFLTSPDEYNLCEICSELRQVAPGHFAFDIYDQKTGSVWTHEVKTFESHYYLNLQEKANKK